MLSIRAESYPSSFVENIDLNILQSLEISIFPGKFESFYELYVFHLPMNYFYLGASYDLRVRITRSLADVLHSYFSVDAPESSVASPEPLAAGVLNISDGAAESGYLSTRPEAVRQNSALLPSTPVKSSSGNSLVPMNGSSSRPSRRRSSNFLIHSRSQLNTSTDNLDTYPSSKKLASTVSPPKQEGIYFKYLRVGDINVDVSTSGYCILFYIIRFTRKYDVCDV